MKLKFFLLSIFVNQAVLAQEPVFLKDFSTGGADAFVFDPVIEGIAVNNQLFFIVDDGKHGEELWRTNGAEVGTQLLKDINPNEANSNVSILAAIGNTVYFGAHDDEHGFELWTTQGTPSSTKVIDIKPGTGASGPNHAVVFNNTLYFSANGIKGRELYRSGGSEATTTLIKDLNTKTSNNGLPFSSSPTNLTVAGNIIFFTANDGEHGTELWRTNGTASGTVMVKDINEGQFSTSFSDFKAGANLLYFLASDGEHGRELWVSDGTENGTYMISDISEGSASSSIVMMEEVNGTFYFTVSESFIQKTLWKTDGDKESASKVGGNINAREFTRYQDNMIFKGNNKLWKADGSVETQIADVFVSGEFASAGGLLYFAGNANGSGNGIWKTNGNTGGATLVKEITSASHRSIVSLTAAGDRVFFIPEHEEFGRELWTSDGTANGTFMLIDAVPGEEDGFESYRDVKFAVAGNLLYFTGWDEEHGRELWKTNGSTEGTVLVKDIHAMSKPINLASDLVPFGEEVYFLTDAGLWKTSGAHENTSLVKETVYASGLNIVNNKLLFTASTEELGRTIWTSDGSVEGTQPLFDAETMPASVFLFQQNLPQVNGNLFFSGRDNDHGNELWKTDGTAEGTTLVKDIFPGPDPSFYSFSSGYAVLNGFFYFTADDGVLGEELWKSDGTEAGTVPVSDINPFGSSGIGNLTVMNGQIFFTANDGAAGYELWKSDGTTEGTQMVKDINPGPGDGVRFYTLVHFQGEIYFGADDVEHGRELWKSDGTEAGTVLVKDIYPKEGAFNRSGNPQNFYVAGNMLYFTAQDAGGIKLWRIDPAGVVEPAVNLEAGYFTTAVEAAGSVFFPAKDSGHGFELWRMPDQNQAPVLMADILPGTGSSEPNLLGYYNSVLYFTAIDGVHGRELWSLSPLEMQANIVASQTNACDASETISFTINATSAGTGPRYQWFLNNQPVANQTGQVFSFNGFSQNDKVKALVIAGDDVWVKNDSLFSNEAVISFEVPEVQIVISGATLSASEGSIFKWFLDGELLDESTRTITVHQSGAYQVEVTNDAGCSALSNEVFFTITAIDDQDAASNKVYPNPVESRLVIERNSATSLHVLIYDGNGQKRYERTLKPGEREIAIDHLSPGIYFLRYWDATESNQVKLVKK